MIKKYFNIAVICTLLPALVSAQSLNKAKRQMEKYNYSAAIETLKKAVDKEKTHDAALPLLGECYRLQHDIINARATYAKAVALPDAKPEMYFYYAQALQSTGNYTKAREIFRKYSEMSPSDSRGKLYLAHCDSVLGPWKGLTPKHEAKLVNRINTEESDFGPAFYEGALIFTSDFSDNPGEGKKYGWTGRGYLRIMKSDPVIKDDFGGKMGEASMFDKKFNFLYHDGPAAFSTDGKSIYFTRSFYGRAKREGKYKTNLLKIYYATKTDSVWGEVMPFYLNSPDYSVGHPTLSADGQTLYFVSDMPGGEGGTDIWMCKRKDNAWDTPINLGNTVNTSESEMFPTMRDDGTLYFSSDGHPGYGALDILRTKNVNGSWTIPENLHPPINGSFDDFAIAFAEGDENGYFSSNRLLGVGSDDIYAFRIAQAPDTVPVLPAYITGVVRDRTTMQPLPGAFVFLYNTVTGSVRVLKSDTDGIYKTGITKPADYVIKAMMPNYIAACLPFTMKVVLPGRTSKVPNDLLLEKLVVNKTFKIDNIYYNFDKYNIREDARVELEKLVDIMSENAINVELGSHTDSRGSNAYNDKLSQRRAESAVKYIVSAGIDENRITAKGYGEHQLTNKCSEGVECTTEEHQANRRTEFKVISFTNKNASTEYDLSKFKANEEIPVYTFEQNFFANCLKDSLKTAINANPHTTVSPSVKENEIHYKVNLYSLSYEKSLDDAEFKKLDHVQMYEEDGKFKYTSGIFTSFIEAEKYMKTLVDLGYKDAFVVAFSYGKRINLGSSDQ